MYIQELRKILFIEIKTDKLQYPWKIVAINFITLFVLFTIITMPFLKLS